MTLLSVKNLCVSFPKSEVVRNVSFSLQEGEILGIVGESGCGKSTLAKAILKLTSSNTHLSGEILYQEKNLLSLSEKEMQKIRGKEIAMIFQDSMTALNPLLKIKTQILEGYRHHHPQISLKQANIYAEELLDLVGISDKKLRLGQFPHQLSGGLRQRVMIALALAAKPKLLVADEPTTALDMTIQAQILELLKTLQKKTNTTILLITHDLSVIANICTRVLVMYAGKIIENAPVEKLFFNPEHPYTERLLKTIPRLDTPQDLPLLTIEGFPPDLSKPIRGCSFAPRCPYTMPICTLQEPILQDHRPACWKKQ